MKNPRIKRNPPITEGGTLSCGGARSGSPQKDWLEITLCDWQEKSHREEGGGFVFPIPGQVVACAPAEGYWEDKTLRSCDSHTFNGFRVHTPVLENGNLHH